MTERTITLVSTASGQSESLPLQSTTTLGDVLEWSKALFGFDDQQQQLVVYKDGQPLLHPSSFTLEQAGIQNGDLLAVSVPDEAAVPQPANRTAASSASGAGSAAAAAAGAGAGLDFSNLLAAAQQQAPAAAASSTALTPATTSFSSSSSTPPPAPVYYPGMNLNEAMQYNPHPHAFISLLQSKDHLFKELNYHSPVLASKLHGQPLDRAVAVWREELIKGGIQQALQATTRFHTEQEMTRRLQVNPNDVEAQAYFQQQSRRQKVHEHYQQMMQEYPESLGRVLMLYISCKINGYEIAAFCDTGAQATIMSHTVAKACGLDEYIDTRFAGTAVGVGTGKILGRIHVCQMQIGDYYFPCSVTVMESPSTAYSSSAASGGGATGLGKEMPFLLGLDMMKRHTCLIDLEQGVLKFRLGPGQFLEAPFLHEKDLTEEQGGTKGFNADEANQKLLLLEEQAERDEKGNGKNNPKDDHDSPMEG